MKYAFQIDGKSAEVNCDEELTQAELEIAKEMLVKLIDSRIEELNKRDQNKLPLTAKIDSLYPKLTDRSRNVLKRNGCYTIEDVLNCSISDLMNMRNMGKKSIEEIKTRFSVYGHFKGEMEVEHD